jgi:hypothetical protein
MTEARIARKCAVAMMGDAYFEYVNPVAFKRLKEWRRNKSLIGILEKNMERATQDLKRKLFEDLYAPLSVQTDRTSAYGLSGMLTVVHQHGYKGIIRV